MSSKIFDSFFGPLGRKYCIYFYILGIITIVGAGIIVISNISYGIYHKKNLLFYLDNIPTVIMYFLLYLQNRLLYNMCLGSS